MNRICASSVIRNMLKYRRFSDIAIKGDELKPVTRKNRGTQLKKPKHRDLWKDVERLQMQVKRSMQHMIEDNQITFEQQDTWFIMRTFKGKYMLHPSFVNNTMMFISPNTGYNAYIYYPEDNVWLSNKGATKGDTHDFREMFTKDITKYHIGCPDFNYPDMNTPGMFIEDIKSPF